VPESRTQRGQARQRAAAATRDRLLTAATDLFAENGSEKTTIAMVARRAGVASGTVHLHFADREALLQAVLDQALAQLKLALAEAAGGKPQRTAAADVRQRTEGLIAFAVGEPELAAVLFQPVHLATPAGHDALEFLVASQAAALTEGQQRGWVRPEVVPDLAGRALVGSLVQVLGWWVRRRRAGVPAPDEAAIVATLAELRLYGTALRPRE
jgi:AcrR family transcriptional regulator